MAIEFWLPDRSLVGFTSLSIGARAASYWAGVIAVGPKLVLVNDDEVVPPRRPDSWEIRAEGLWADHNCEIAGEHWSFGLEAFGVAFDDPVEAVRPGAWGDRVALGYDLEWDDGAVFGEVLIGDERIEFDGAGTLTVDGDESGAARWTRLARAAGTAGTADPADPAV